MIVRNSIKQVSKKIRNYNSNRNNLRKQKSLTNDNFTLLTRNCIAGIVLHDLNKRFDTPTINLYMDTKDFILFVKYLKEYSESSLVENLQSTKEFPVGVLIPKGNQKPIELFFMHYNTFDEAKTKWCERTKRIHYDNIYIILEEDTKLEHQDLLEFDKLEYEHKIALTDKKYLDIKSSYYMPALRGAYPGKLLDYTKNSISGKRYLDEFDYVSFLNGK